MTLVPIHYAYLAALGGLLVGIFVWPTLYGPVFSMVSPTTGILLSMAAVLFLMAWERFRYSL